MSCCFCGFSCCSGRPRIADQVVEQNVAWVEPSLESSPEHSLPMGNEKTEAKFKDFLRGIPLSQEYIPTENGWKRPSRESPLGFECSKDGRNWGSEDRAHEIRDLSLTTNAGLTH